jgi:hypothetical protein
MAVRPVFRIVDDAGVRLAGFVRCGKTITNAADEKPQGSLL